MRRDNDTGFSDTGRYLDDEDFLDDHAEVRGFQQNPDTLRLGYPWIQHFQREHPGYEFVKFESPPAAAPPADLPESRVVLVSTAGVYEEGQKAFSIAAGLVDATRQRQCFWGRGDPSFRTIPARSDPSKLRISYPYLNTTAAEEDINTLFPITRLLELEEESVIGSVGENHFSFMGYLPDPWDLETALSDAIGLLKQDQVDFAILTPAEVLSHQSMGILQRALEEAGIATISIALCRDVIENMQVPRAVHYRFPFGYTFGDPNDGGMQLRLLKDTLRAFEEIEEGGTIVDLPYEWSQL